MIPAHNAAGTIRQTLLACIDQRDEQDRPIACEVLVVDDASKDTTAAIAGQVAMTAPRHATVRYLRAGGEQAEGAITPVGPALARKAGLEQATGEFVCFVDADDVPSPHHAGVLLGAIESAGADAATGGYDVVDEHLDPLGLVLLPEARPWPLDALRIACRFLIGATVVRRGKLLAAMRSEPEMFRAGQRLEDWVMWICLARWSESGEGDAVRWAPSVRLPLVAYRQAPTSRSRATIPNLHAGVEIVRRFAPPQQQASAGAQLARGAICEAMLDHSPEQLREATEVLKKLLAGEKADHQASTANGGLGQGGGGVAGDEAFSAPLHWSLGIRGWLRPDRVGAALKTLPSLFGRLAPAGPDVDWQRLLRSCLCSAEAVGRAAQLLAHTLPPGRRLVIYGLGQNGQAALRALAGKPNTVAIDDDESKACSVPRITTAELTREDVVLVTPVRREGVLTRLKGGPSQVSLPEDVLRDAAPTDLLPLI